MKYIVLIIAFLSSASVFSQRQNNRSRSELGILVGGSYYIGDLNRFSHFKNTHLAGGILYRYNIHSRLAWRTTFSYYRVDADDAESDDVFQQQRNLSFKSDIWELASGVEFNYFPFQIGHSRYRGTAYLFVEIAGFRMNPKALYDGDYIALQPLGTEGQGTSFNSRRPYDLFQLAIPLGVGGRISLGNIGTLGLEFGIRKTFTDYIDDVGSSVYADPDQLLAENGPVSASLANKSGSATSMRGNASTKDWYVFTGATLTFRLGGPNNCTQPD